MPDKEEERREIPQNNLGVKKIPFELTKNRLRGIWIMRIRICGQYQEESHSTEKEIEEECTDLKNYK